MPSVGAQNVSIVFGDLSYFCVRCSMDPLTYVSCTRKPPGLIEKGEFGLAGFRSV